MEPNSEVIGVDVQGPSSLPRPAAGLVAALDQLGPAGVHVCGVSMGGLLTPAGARASAALIAGARS